jgi:hypothetical protein
MFGPVGRAGAAVLLLIVGVSASIGSTADSASAASRPALSSAIGPPPGTLHSLPPTRLVDTRSVRGGALGSASRIRVQIGGRDGVPTSGVGAVNLHVTVANVLTSGYLTVYPDGPSRPPTSSLNYVPDRIISNSVLVHLPADGVVDVFASGGPVDVIVDLTGWFGTGPVPGGFVAVPQRRLLDTRSGHAPGSPPPVGIQPFSVQVAGVANVPVDASAVALNLTSVNSAGSWPIVAWAAGPGRLSRPSIRLRIAWWRSWRWSG